ncbi:MAG TPA: penicillin-binding protein 2 [Gaiellaceae bacterium]|nr:penicillin-binding protein 2 [Gaiellaceae bacterium]
MTPQTALRIAILGVLAVVLFCALFFRLWALQVISGEKYLEDAKNNQVRTFRVPAQRGTIVDRNGNVLVSNRPGTQIRLWPATFEDMTEAEITADFRRLSKLLGLELRELREALERGQADPLTPVVLKTSVQDFKVNYLLEHQREFPGVQITPVQLRNYDHGSTAAQILGYVGEIDAKQLEAREGEDYAAGDIIGQAGVEATYDRYLRGRPGVGQVRVDAMGRITSRQEFSQLAQPGYSVKLTLDSELQEAAESAIAYGIRLAQENGEYYADGGAIVAIDPRDGAILALASSPSFEPEVFVERKAKDLERLAEPSANHPTLNRPVAGLYPPGSTFKPVTALAALETGLVTPHEVIQCDPSFEVAGQTFANWDPFYNQAITLVPAIAMSCDTYFYRLAMRFYQAEGSPLQRWARRMGLGATTGVDVGPEAKGLIPTPTWRHDYFDHPWDKVWRPGDSVQLSIGQGDVLTTPLQMTRLYALIANDGRLVEPHLVSQIEEPSPNEQAPVVVRTVRPKPPQEVGLDPANVAIVQEGLVDAAQNGQYGTSAAVFGGFPISIAGKTGTAEKWQEIPGYPNGMLLDQSWWCGYGPTSSPEIVVCALIENGGHGGTAAAPAAMQVFSQYFGVEPTPIGQVHSD